ncbi:MAG TPA: type 4a pilus biogenesis protein PilO [Gemmatimonadales bacterium]|jgi:type IV pilus assembly protein PilO
MAFGLPTDQRGQIMALLVLVALAGGYLFWSKVHQPSIAQISAANAESDSLESEVEAAKRDLASGSLEDLRRHVEEYQGSLELMRRLVPERNEVPTLIDDISTKAKVRGVTVGKIQPLPPEPGSPFDVYRYRLEVYGHYDQLGEYLADIASLPRIVVPEDIALSPASGQAQRLLADTAGALLLAEFSLRTFVKSAGPPPGTRPAGAPRARN